MKLLRHSDLAEFNQSVAETQPRWLRILGWTVAATFGAVWAFLVQSGVGLDHPRIAIAVMATFFAVGAMQLFFIARAFWRMDI